MVDGGADGDGAAAAESALCAVEEGHDPTADSASGGNGGAADGGQRAVEEGQGPAAVSVAEGKGAVEACGGLGHERPRHGCAGHGWVLCYAKCQSLEKTNKV